MALREAWAEEALRRLKRMKLREEMVRDLELVIQKLRDALDELKKFEQKWGLTDETLAIVSELERQLGIHASLKPSLFNRLTGRYYLRLALELLTIIAKLNSSVLSVPELLIALRNELGFEVGERDVKRALRHLEERGLVRLKGDRVVYVPALDADAREVIKRFSSREFVTPEEVMRELNWPASRAIEALERLVELGQAVKEEWPVRYWFVRPKSRG